MKLLDLFCGAGGAAKGYHDAGFEVVGVDIKPQPNYPYEFHQADAMTYPLDGYDMIHASPPCQRWSIASRNIGTAHRYPDLLTPTRERLKATTSLWVIENVPPAPLRADIKLCGCMFGLRLRRKRHFETSWNHFELRQPCLHLGPVPSVVGHGTPTWVREKLGYNPTIAEYRQCMGIDWMNRDELSQAIPPAYTRYIGERALEALGAAVRAMQGGDR